MQLRVSAVSTGKVAIQTTYTDFSCYSASKHDDVSERLSAPSSSTEPSFAQSYSNAIANVELSMRSSTTRESHTGPIKAQHGKSV